MICWALNRASSSTKLRGKTLGSGTASNCTSETKLLRAVVPNAARDLLRFEGLVLCLNEDLFGMPHCTKLRYETEANSSVLCG